MSGRKTTTPTAAHHIYNRLRPMIRSKDWDRIDRMLQQHQHTTTSSAPSSRSATDIGSIEEILQVIISNGLQFDILKNIDDDGAKSVFFMLVRIGGKNLVMAKDKTTKGQGGNSSLHIMCDYKNPQVDVISNLVEVGGLDIVMAKNNYGDNSLHRACKNNASIDVVSKLIEVGGKELIMAKNKKGWHSLHVACQNNATVDIISKLVKVGGKKTVMAKNNNYIGWNSLHRACQYNASINVVSKLIEMGGKNLIMAKDKYGWNSLHRACTNNASFDVVSKLIEVGGKKLVVAKNNYGWNSLHVAFGRGARASFDVVSKLIEVGGKEVVMAENIDDRNPIEIAVQNIEVHTDILDLLIQYEGQEALTKVNRQGKTLLDIVITSHSGGRMRALLVERTAFFITKGIELRVGGEYDIGGLFNSHREQEQKDEIYARWDEVVCPALEQVMALPNSHHQPLLQAAIIANAPPHIIKTIVRCFPDTIKTADSFGRYPIDLAVSHRLAWDDGTKQIVEAFASSDQTTKLYICAKHGVQWNNGTKEVLEGSDVDIVERKDASTGLYPFMLAAAKEKYCYDLEVVYHLISRSPKLLQQQYCGNHKEELCSRKRRRS